MFNSKLENNWKRIKNYIFKSKTDLSCNNLGWGTMYNSKNNQDLVVTGKEAALRHTISLKNNLCYSENLKTLHSIIDFSKKKNVKIIFITCPAYSTYVEHINKEQLDNTINTITQIVNENPNTQYYNLLNSNMFLDIDFYDADHLNEKGSKKFTGIIDSILNIK